MRTLALVLLVSIAPIAMATTHLVSPNGSGDFPTIQAAIDAAQDGDIVELADGVFAGSGNYDLDFQGKAIIVRSQSGAPTACVIDCAYDTDQHRGFSFTSGEEADSIVEGISVINGNSGGDWYSNAGALWIEEWSSPTIRNCIFRDNRGQNGGVLTARDHCHVTFEDCQFIDNSAEEGGALYLNFFCNATLTRCVFRENDATDLGGAVRAYACNLQIDDCQFVSNTAPEGGACYFESGSPSLEHCTLVANSADLGGAIYCRNGANVTVSSSIVAFSGDGQALECAGAAAANLACCDVYNNNGGDWVDCIADQNGADGNFSADPCFCDILAGDVYLCDESLCLPENSPSGCGEVIGALTQGCTGCACLSVRGEPASWSDLKALFD